MAVRRYQGGGPVTDDFAPRAWPAVPPAPDLSLGSGQSAPGFSFAPRAQLVPTAPGIAPASYSTLDQARTGIGQELQNPETRRLLAASTYAEVGDQPQMQQAYMESVINRAVASQRSLSSTLRSSYYPAATRNQLGRTFTADQMGPYNQLIDSVLGGSNVSNLATGNESGKVRSGGAAVVYPEGATHTSPGERFIAENDYTDWRNQMLGTLAPQHFQTGGPVTKEPEPSPAEKAALQQAGQYAGTRDVLTPENAPQYGLDPSKGFIARGTPSPPPAPNASQATWNPLPILKQILETRVPGVPPLYQGSEPAPSEYPPWNPLPILK